MESPGDAAVIVEALPSTLLLTENVVILSTWGAALLLISLAIIFQVWKRTARLPVLLAVCMLLAIGAATVSTWAVTISSAHTVVTRQTQRLLLSAGRQVRSDTQAQLGEGIALAGRIRELITTGLLRTEAPFPEPHQHLWAVLANSQEAHARSIYGAYWGIETGETVGIFLFTAAATRTTGEVKLWVTAPPMYCPPGAADKWSDPNNGCTTVTELMCESNNDRTACEHPACIANDSTTNGTQQCAFCNTNLGRPCEGCECGEWVPPASEEWTVSVNSSEWTSIPSNVMSRGGFCHKAPPTHPPAGSSENPGTPLESEWVTASDGTRWYGGKKYRGNGGCGYDFDPRMRPWYSRNEKLVWSDPYRYAGDAFGELGISVSVGVRNTNYSGKPYNSGVPPNMGDTPWMGVVGVDFSFSSFTSFLELAKPSPSSVLFVVDDEGNLLGSSAFSQEYGKTQTEVKVTSATFPHRDLFLRLERRFGSLRGAAQVTGVLQGEDSVDLVMPIDVPAKVLMVVISMPYADVSKEAEESSTKALGMAVGISVFCALAIYAMNELLLRPLQLLQADMKQVSVMELARAKECQGSRTREVNEMTQYFTLMVRALGDYRAYLPAAILGKGGYAPIEAPRGLIALVFTDIVGSTRLWELSPVSMAEALELHNDLARDLIAKHRGYEVKTIGDSFMIAFDDPCNAVLFAVRFQDGLLAVRWPEDPAFDDFAMRWRKACDEDGTVVWNGIAVRCGVSYGECQHETNPMTHRIDYRGRYVNLAARLEGAAPHGLVLISDECSHAITGLREVSVEALPARELRGLGTVSMCLVLTPRLFARWQIYRHKDLIAPRRGNNPLLSGLGRHDSVIVSEAGSSEIHSSVRSDSVRSVSPRASDLGVRLSKRHGTIAVAANLDFGQSVAPIPDRYALSMAVSTAVRLVISGAMRFQGMVQSLQGASCLVFWNVTSPCADHRSQAVAFGSLISTSDRRIHMGIGSGEFFDGSVGLARHRFHSAFGLPVLLADALARVVTDYGIRCAAVFVPETPAGQMRSLRPVDIWGINLSTHTITVTIEEVCEVKLEKMQDLAPLPDDESGDGALYRAAFTAVVTKGGEDALAELAKLMPEEGTSRSVVLRMLATHLQQHPRGSSFRTQAPIPGQHTAAWGAPLTVRKSVADASGEDEISPSMVPTAAPVYDADHMMV
eukprot:Hpha_TRINITY_DN15771_c2_g1::TRINITY_DN15771_c2_g1_i1::g.40696::m.40696